MCQQGRGERVNMRKGAVLKSTPLQRWDSLRKLSSFHIFAMAAFVQPSAMMMGSISSRRGCKNSGLATRSSMACVKLCEIMSGGTSLPVCST